MSYLPKTCALLTLLIKIVYKYYKVVDINAQVKWLLLLELAGMIVILLVWLMYKSMSNASVYCNCSGTIPSSFKLETFVNNLSKPNASTFEKLGM